MERPFSPEDFAACMAATSWAGDALAVAVSGGPDSMALALLARDWAKERGVRLLALTLDHALRAESAAEAKQVQHWLQAQHIAQHIIRWEHPPVTQAVQQKARQARYALLAEACRAHGIHALALAHQQEDQAETLLLRLAKGSGVDGLAAMRPLSRYQDITLLRPLLTVPKARLVATCVAAGQEFVRDPSNQNPAYARARLRTVTEALATEGLTAERLGDCAARAALASDALAFYTNRLAAQAVTVLPTGVVRLTLALWRAEPEEIRLRLLRQILDYLGGHRLPPRHAALVGLEQALQQSAMLPRTLHGCIVTQRQNNGFFIREAATIHDIAPIAAGESRVWDGRFRVTIAPHAPEGLVLAKLGTAPHAQIDHIAPQLRHAVPQGRVRATLPALWQDQKLVAVAANTMSTHLMQAEALLYPDEFVLS